MDKKKLLAVLLIASLMIAFSGCSGDGDKGEGEGKDLGPILMEKVSTMEGTPTWVETDSGTDTNPGEGTAKFAVSVPGQNVVEIEITLIVNDYNEEHSGEQQTKPDQIMGGTANAGAGGNDTGNASGGGGSSSTSKSIPPGPTPYTSVLTFDAQYSLDDKGRLEEGATFLPTTVNIEFDVETYGAPGQTPGFFIYYGYIDYGFEYTYSVSYTELVPETGGMVAEEPAA